MGKKRIAIISGEDQTTVSAKSAAAKGKLKEKPVVQSGKGGQGKLTDMGAVALAEMEKIKAAEKKAEEKKTAPEEKLKKVKVKVRSRSYKKARQLIDPVKLYPPKEAIELLKKISLAKFNGSIEVHLNATETGTLCSLKFPFAAGKTRRVQIADDQTIGAIEKGKLDFDLLLATPEQMPKLVKFAKILGPRGLMPNPKNQTITTNPEKRKKELETQKTEIKTEKKAPLIHLVIGRLNQPEKELLANLNALIEALPPTKIQKIYLCSSMSPSIKVAFLKTS
jgi:large subunit ribosomal protein L1